MLFDHHRHLREAITAKSDCPTAILNDAIRLTPSIYSSSATSAPAMHDHAWARARVERFNNPSLALSLATKDPDSWERNEAVNQILMTPMESFSESDRAYLAGHIREIPGPHNQVALAESLVGYAKNYCDDTEKWHLADALTGRNTLTAPGETYEAVIRIGETLDPQPAAPAPKRGWFR